MKWTIVLTYMLAALGLLQRAEAQQARRAEVVVWLLPAEPGVQPTSADTAPSDAEIDRINLERVPPGVVLENTTDPRLREQLSAWNPEFAVPNLAWLRGQTATLQALGRFARNNNVTVRVRFWTWASIFSALNSAIESKTPPDVSQVGSGWVAYLRGRGRVAAFGSGVPAGLRRDFAGANGVSLRYTTDVRLIYYWRRLPRSQSGPLQLDASSWPELFDSLAARNAPPFAFPIGASLNLVHDLLPLMDADPAMLLHKGLTGPYIRFDANALNVPSQLSNRALGHDARGLPHRVIAFPEVTHEEAIQSFYLGGYVGIIEPIGFLRRWFDAFHSLPGKEIQGGFEDYADAVAPPSGFKGGSDLVVFTTPRRLDAAQNLAKFLATDKEYTEMLAKNGNLPVARGAEAIPLLMGPMARSDEARRWLGKISEQIERSIQTAREEPQLESWPTEIESREVLESIQNVWRRIADGDPAALTRAAAVAERTINERINPGVRAWNQALRFWQLFSVLAVIGISFFALYRRQREKHAEEHRRDAETARVASEQARERAEQARIASDEARRQADIARAEADRAREASDRARKIQGFTAAALGVVDQIHKRKRRFSAPGSLSSVAEKSALVEVGLDGWLRGLDPENWRPRPLDEVIWRSILLALDFQKAPWVFAKWSADEKRRSPREFLSDQGLLRASREPSVEVPSFHFAVVCEAGVLVEQPFMMEQCLTCLLQNAIAASETESPEGKFPTFSAIDLKGTEEALELRNDCFTPFSDRLAEVLNDESPVEEFVTRIRELLVGPPIDRPGLGTIVSYLIASECYGGISVRSGSSDTSVRVRVKSAGKSYSAAGVK